MRWIFFLVGCAATLGAAVSPDTTAKRTRSEIEAGLKALETKARTAKEEPKEAELIRACNEGDVLYLPDRLAEKACRKTGFGWRLLGLSHRLASPEDLAKRSRSTEWVERMAVARNPNTPPNIIDHIGRLMKKAYSHK